jgi:hypothetical protein
MADPNAEFFGGIRQDIDNAMVAGNEGEALFVTRDNLEKIWSNRLERFCEIARLGEIGIRAAEQLKKELLQTLSILVYIGWGAWHKFNDIFFNSLYYSKPGSRWDKNIESYTQAQLENRDFLGDRVMARLFIQCRDTFIPIVIEEGSVVEFKAGRRLPLLRSEDGSKVLGKGAFGTVTKEFIAIKQYKHDDKYNWVGNF